MDTIRTTNQPTNKADDSDQDEANGEGNPNAGRHTTTARSDLSDSDVLCTRDKSLLRHHPGNCFFRAHIDTIIPVYKQAETKLEKMDVIRGVVDDLRIHHRVRFVKLDATTSSWIEVEDMIAREKVGQAIRSAIHRKEKKKKQRVVPKNTRKALADAAARRSLAALATSMNESSSESESATPGAVAQGPIDTSIPVEENSMLF